VEMALLDALTRSLKIPLWRFFGPRAATLATDITLVLAGPEQTRESVRAFVRSGFDRFKIKVGLDPEADLERVRIVHAAAPRAEIMLDANQGYTPPAALKFLRRLARCRIRPILVEQPVHRDDWDGMRWITRRSPSPICADESLRSVADVVRVARLHAAHAINIKLAKFGFLQAIQMAALARATGLSRMIGSMMETNLSATAAAHFAAGIGDFAYVDLDTPYFIPGHAAANPWLSRKGVYVLSRVPAGIGIKPD
jgi:L-Ala-D/L-Glu epimerase